ncbi:MAG: hypothetical protein CMH53_06745 [Myxococcales bacterium]|nr:hypothetical protein [Myxococcales bacterium]
MMNGSHTLLWLSVIVLTTACGGESSPKPPPPLAGLQHPAVARVGEVVTFDGSPSVAGVLRNADGNIVEQASIVQFRFLFADGSEVKTQAAAVGKHVFDEPGLYAVKLEVVDARDRTSEVISAIHITTDFTTICSEDQPADCPSGRCLAGVCNRIACAGQAVCPTQTTCADAQCLTNPPPDVGGDAFTGADGGAITVGADAASSIGSDVAVAQDTGLGDIAQDAVEPSDVSDDAQGSSDAGETDAGETDAGETDAGQTDAGADSIEPTDEDAAETSP